MTFLKSNSFYLKEKIITETNPSIQNNFSTSSWLDINYSSIDYLPAPFSSFVVYEYSFWYGEDGQNGNDIVNIKAKLLSDGSDYNENTECVLGHYVISPSFKGRRIAQIKFCLDASNWTSSKSLKLQGRKINGDVRLHQLDDFYGSSGSESGNHYYYPTVRCYSIG